MQPQHCSSFWQDVQKSNPSPRKRIFPKQTGTPNAPWMYRKRIAPTILRATNLTSAPGEFHFNIPKRLSSVRIRKYLSLGCSNRRGLLPHGTCAASGRHLRAFWSAARPFVRYIPAAHRIAMGSFDRWFSGDLAPVACEYGSGAQSCNPNVALRSHKTTPIDIISVI